MGKGRNIDTVIREGRTEEITQHDVDVALGIKDGEDKSKIKFKPSFQKFTDFNAGTGGSIGDYPDTFLKFQNTMPKKYLESPRGQGDPSNTGVPAGATRFYGTGPVETVFAALGAVDEWWQETQFKNENKDLRKEVSEEVQSVYKDRQTEQAIENLAESGLSGDDDSQLALKEDQIKKSTKDRVFEYSDYSFDVFS